MKKILILFLFFVIFVLGCNKGETTNEPIITADVVDSGENFEDITKNAETVRLCHDTDNGIVRWKEGSVFGFYDNATRFEFNDYCLDRGHLMEFYCEDENPVKRLFSCTQGCDDNHCL